MKYDFVVLEGIEKGKGDCYLSTPVIPISDQNARLVFAKAFLSNVSRPDDILVLREMIVRDATKTDDVYCAVAKCPSACVFYLVRDAKGIEIIEAKRTESTLRLQPQCVGIVNKESLFRELPDLEQTIRRYLRRIA